MNSGKSLESGVSDSVALGLDEAMRRVSALSPGEIERASDATVIHVGLSAEFAQGHLPGASWVPRGWMEFRIDDVAPDKAAPVIVTCSGSDSRQAVFAAATLLDMGYTKVSALDGGMSAWQDSGRAVEKGLTGVMYPPSDLVASGPDRNFADKINYLRWEEELGHKYAPHR